MSGISSGLNSKCKFMRFLCIIQLHVLLIISVISSKVHARTCHRSSTSLARTGGCPIQATKSFFGRQMALFTQSLTSTSINIPKMFYDSGFMPKKTAKVGGYKITRNRMELSVATENVKPVRANKISNGPLEVIVLGLSHHNAQVDVREKLAIPEDNWGTVAAELCQCKSITEAAVLSTCNRFEVYLAGPNQYECIRDAIDFLLKRAEEKGGLDQVTLRKNLFMLSGEDAVWHLLRVAAGLDSLIVGEGQILAQVKRAYEKGTEEGGQAGKVLSRMLNSAVTAGKRVRAETGISRGAVSISSAAAEFSAMKIQDDCGVPDMAAANVAIIGAGKMARLLVVHLQSQGVKEITVVNRSPERVEELKNDFPDIGIIYRGMVDMWDVIRNSDIVYPSTAATTTIIDPAPLQQALLGRSRPGGVQLVDISVPRNVHADCESVPGVSSYNVDHLKAVVEKNTAKRRREMVEAEGILREEQDKYQLWQQSLGAIPTIARLQEKAESLRLEEFQKANKKLANLTPKDLEAVDRLSKGIVAKLLHGPMNHLRAQKEVDATRAAIQQVQQAFQLE